MAQRKNGKNQNGTLPLFSGIKDETKRAIFGIFFLVLAIILLLSGLGRAGAMGETLYQGLSFILGIGYYILPILSFLISLSLFRPKGAYSFLSLKVFGAILFFLSGLATVSLIDLEAGGLVGSLVAYPIVTSFDLYAGGTILISLLVISSLLIFDFGFSIFHPLFSVFNSIKGLFSKKDEVGNESESVEESGGFIDNENAYEEETSENETEENTAENTAHTIKPKTEPKETEQKSSAGVFMFQPSGKAFTPPPLSLVEKDKGKPGVGDIKANANIIKRTLANFGIIVEMDEITIGPTVTRYALKPAEGVKLSRIVALQNDLSYALAAHPIRIEAPIPGKSLVGVEIPNSIKATVGLGNLLAAEDFQNSEKPLLVALGKGISGKSHFANVAKMPHLLVAGATGSGKSVTIHALITSLLFRNAPENLRFIMIDPKRVELTLYNSIPHLLSPVITDAKRAIQSLKWAAKEMDRRYDILEAESVRDIESYHKNVLSPSLEKLAKDGGGENAKQPEAMPYIVIIIDELADIMQTYPRELEAAIVRLAQMSRAVGIHLILSTQRPSVNVITGLIKANVPARIALQVASQIDSRTILDMAGAEKLLGAGDMLYLSGEMSQPQRIQSPFISEGEVKAVVKHLKQTYQDEIPNEVNFASGGDASGGGLFSSAVGGDDDVDDDLYEQAREVVISTGKASTSFLQRKLGIGYARAARLIDILEEKGVVGPGNGAKPREVVGYSGKTAETEEGE